MNRFGEIAASKIYDIDNTAYYLDPASPTTSLNVAGDIITTSDIQATGRLGLGLENTTS